ncbi:alkaline phosphatase PhoX [Streptomyces sp. 4N509B]|uniref:alkaline phosphatase PhoX n=1 Tax=Streptomyces sp. 4N509B TaxID=3457413 RepID=UPI003FD4D089
MPLSRRQFVRRSAATAGVALTGSVGALATAPGALGESAATGGPGAGLGYGPLLPDPEGVLSLPEGFRYRVVNWAGRTTLESGEPTPTKHDGTGTFAGRDGRDLLVVNHELDGPRADWEHPVPLAEGLVYDPAAAGGCTVVEIPRDGGPVTEWVAIAGTSTNCAGGTTPWETWLTCEETEDRAGEAGMTRDHGYVFEVDPHDRDACRDPEPIRALGRFAHEAVVVDPHRGHLYLTEDADEPNGLLYRWTPPRGFRHGRGRLGSLPDDAGALQAFRCVDDRGRFVDDLSRATRVGTVHGVDWIDVPDRDARDTPLREQFRDGRVTRARKLEGMWWGDGGAYFVSSYARAEDSPGTPHDGQVWFYDPRRRTVTLTVRFGVTTDPSGTEHADGPDNITVSPYGGLILAEDGEGLQHLIGAAGDGRTFPLARNELNVGTEAAPEFSEFAGVTFSPDGQTLYASIQEPGVLLAVTGPWRRQR